MVPFHILESWQLLYVSGLTRKVEIERKNCFDFNLFQINTLILYLVGVSVIYELMKFKLL